MVLNYRYRKGWKLKDIAEKMNATPKGLYFVEQSAISKLSKDKLVQEAGVIYGYKLSATDTYNRCVGDEKEWNGSPVESMAIKHLELENRLKALKERMVSHEA